MEARQRIEIRRASGPDQRAARERIGFRLHTSPITRLVESPEGITRKSKMNTRGKEGGIREDRVDSSGKKPAEKPVSLHPLKFEEAVRGLLLVKPSAEKLSRDSK